MIMYKRVRYLPLVAFILLNALLVGCGTTKPPLAEGHRVSQLSGVIELGIETRDEEVRLIMTTDPLYGCANTAIYAWLDRAQRDQLTIVIEGIDHPRLCNFDRDAPARKTITLGHLRGDYFLNLVSQAQRDRYRLQVTTNRIQLEPETTTFTRLNRTDWWR